MKKLLLVLTLIVGSVLEIVAQSSCNNAVPMCANGITAPNVTGVPSLGSYGCLGSTPNAGWYYIKVGSGGTINIQISQSSNGGSGLDVDYALWGPFSDPTTPCSGLPNGSPVRCSYSTASVENFSINGSAGQYYMMLVTNFNGGAGVVFIGQTNLGAPGSGTLDCTITAPCVDPTTTIYATTSAGSGYFDMVEGCTCGQIDIWLSAPYATSTALQYGLAGTATAPLDYNNMTGYIGFSPGSNHGSAVLCPIADGLTEGVENVVFTLYGACNFDTIGQITFNIQDEYPHSASAVPTTVCAGSTVQLNATGRPGARYSWRPPASVSNPNIANPTAVVTTTTTFYVDIDNSDPAPNSWTGCVYTDSVTITVNPNPTASISGTLAYCQGGSTTLTASGGGTYLWSDAPVNTTTANLTVTSPGPYTVTVTAPNTCTATASATVVENPNPTASISGTLNYCAGSSTTLTASGAGASGSYQWTPSGNTASITASTPGSYTVTATDVNSCSASASATVIENPNPTVSISGNLSYCSGDSTILTASGGVSYQWSNGLPSAASVAVSFPGSVSVTATDINGCTGTATVTVVENATPVITIVGDTFYCAGDSTVLTASGGATYQWSNGLPSSASVTIFAPNTYSVTATTASGCTGTASVTVIEKPLPVVSFTQLPNLLCIGQVPVSISAGSQAGVIYTWSTGTIGDTIMTLSGGTVGVVADLNNCFVTSSYTIISSVPPTLPNMNNNINVCCQDVVLNPNPDPTLTYQWSGGLGSTGSITIVGSNTLVGQTYTLTATNPLGCSVAATDTVSIWCLKMQGLATPDTIHLHPVRETSELTITTEYDNGDFVYIWEPDSNLNPVGSAITTANPYRTTTYNVLVVDTVYGCIDSTTIYLVVIEPGILVMPTAFTPNGDGINDAYYPILFDPHNQTTLYEFRVYNRWGEMLHNDPTKGWDGKYKGEEQPPAEVYNYYVYIEVPDQENPAKRKAIKRSGSFTLLR